MIYSLSGNLPSHIYCYVDSKFILKKPRGFIQCVWFSLVSYPSRLWGCNILLESGAVYRNVPLHALSKTNKDNVPWTEKDAALWDCYGYNFSTIEYTYLKGLDVIANKVNGSYLFTAIPMLDGFSAEPSQSKEFMFSLLNNNRFSAYPTDKILFVDKSFTDQTKKPIGYKLNKEIYRAEGL